jgi:Heterokaryon incompatibility protein (HET)
MENTLYSYRSLPKNGWQFSSTPPSSPDFAIRLVIVYPGELTEPIRFKIIHTTWGKKPEFEALSYVWGVQTPETKIFSSEGYLVVVPNLKDALRRLRSSLKSRALWVDKICINQQDDIERGHQVQAMHIIFGTATETIVWLGEPGPEPILLAFQTLEMMWPKVQLHLN